VSPLNSRTVIKVFVVGGFNSDEQDLIPAAKDILKGHFNHLNTELNPICHLLALLVAHHILHVSRIGVKILGNAVLRRKPQSTFCVSVRSWLHLRHAHLDSFFLDPEVIKILGNVVMRG